MCLPCVSTCLRLYLICLHQLFLKIPLGRGSATKNVLYSKCLQKYFNEIRLWSRCLQKRSVCKNIILQTPPLECNFIDIFLQTPALECIFGDTWSSDIFAGTSSTLLGLLYSTVRLWCKLYPLVRIYCCLVLTIKYKRSTTFQGFNNHKWNV